MKKFNEKQAFMVLNGLFSIGPITLRKLLPAFNNDPTRILFAHKVQLQEIDGISEKTAEIISHWQQWFDLDKEENLLNHLGGSFIHCLDKDYPSLLKEIYDPPIGLYCLGKWHPLQKTIAIVGSRKATLYGLKIAKQLASELARLGFCVVSGLARGIDSAAHEGALSVSGQTIAILGCGLDVIYPPENAELYKKISETGAILTEFSLGRIADKTTFPMRNRIVSGVSQAVIVIESDKNGGSMITANCAAEQGRPLLAVPGRIDQSSSRGCHHLIRDGAALVTCVDDILQEVKYMSQMELPLQSNTYSSPPPLSLITNKKFTIV